MNNYDGSPSGLNEALAALYRSKGNKCSAGNNNRMAELRDEAKAGLGIATKKPNQEQCLAIYQWHFQKINAASKASLIAVENNLQAANDSVEYILQTAIESIEDAQQASIPTVEFIQQMGIDGVENIQQSTNQPVENISQQYNPDKLARVAFYTNIDGIKKRQVIALHGFMLNALMVAIGADDKAKVPQWLNNQPFVSSKSITLQVQQLIVKALIK